jgi:hypothetical protein
MSLGRWAGYVLEDEQDLRGADTFCGNKGKEHLGPGQKRLVYPVSVTDREGFLHANIRVNACRSPG